MTVCNDPVQTLMPPTELTRELWLLRHAEAKQDSALQDFDRPLHQRGVEEANKLGAWLHQQHLLPDLWLSSPALRAITTAELVCGQLAVAQTVIDKDQRLYFKGVGAIKALLAELPQTSRCVLLVGHNPDFERLLAELRANGQPAERQALAFPTASLARLAMPDEWRGLSAGCAGLIAMTKPSSL